MTSEVQMKNKIWIIIGIVGIILLTSGGVLLITSNHQEKEPDIPPVVQPDTPNEEKPIYFNPNIFSFAIKSESIISKEEPMQREQKATLVALTTNGDEISLMDVTKYYGKIYYTYRDYKLYLYFMLPNIGVEYNGPTPRDDEFQHVLGYIDLNVEKNQYTFTKLMEAKLRGWPESIAIIQDDIYYASYSRTGVVYRYNITNQTNTVFDEYELAPDNAVIHLYNVKDDFLIYEKYGNLSMDSYVGIINMKTKENKKIQSDARFEFIYGNKMIFRDDYTNGTWKYYEYDIKSDTINVISDKTSSVYTDAMGNIEPSFIIPYKDGYIYVDYQSLYRYRNHNREKIYEFPNYITEINLLSDNTLYVNHYNGLNENNTLSISDDLNMIETGKEVYYRRLLYIK